MGRLGRAIGWGLILLAWDASAGAVQTSLPSPPKAGAVKPSLRVPRVTRAPQMEDFLNGTPREAEAVITDFRQRDPQDGQPASSKTTAYLSYDEKNLYVVFVCEDDPAQIRARMAKREDIWSDELVAVSLDTFYDRRRSYNFAANPLGIQLDGITTEGQSDDFTFDTLWQSEGQLTDRGFIVWMSIPFKSLRFREAPAQTWGIGVARLMPRNNEESWWPYITRRVEGFVQQLATLEGIEGISPGRNMQFIPYGALTGARFLDRRAPGGPAFRTDTDGRAGLDAKFVLRDALTLDVALNPDFSQVESDEPQVTVNQRFEVFFPEKRPFFIENAGFFRTPINLFFSRRVADPQFGARLTGKVGRWALGGILIDDRAPGRRRPPGDPVEDERAGIGVARVQREFAQQSTFGVLVTSLDFAGSSNRMFSLDTRLKLHPNWVLGAQAMRSYTRNLDGSRTDGPAYFLELQRIGRHYNNVTRYSDRSPDFRAPLGFVPRVDIRQGEHFSGYRWRPKKGRVQSYGPGVFTVVNWDRRGRVQDWFVNANFEAQLAGPFSFNFTRFEGFELFRDFGFRKHSTTASFSTEWLRWLEISTSATWGNGVNFFPPVASGLAPFLANVTNARFAIVVRPTPRFRYEQTYLYTRLGTREGSTPAPQAPGASIFNNHIVRAKVNYQFTRELSLRAILDYNAVLANPDLVALERSKRLTADFLLTYLVNPWTALYIGYTDGYENLILDTTGTPQLRRIGAPTTSTGRQVFAKLSYLFRF